MYYLLSLLTGILISTMVAVNGGLAEQYGVYSATVVIHIAGLLLIAALTAVNRERPFSKIQPWYLYLGGAIGVSTTVFNNLAYGRISVSAIMALGLLGQSVTSLIIDQYGLLHMPRHPFRKQKTLGLVLIFCGIASMINNFEPTAVVVSFAAGVGVVISRTLNARLSDATSVRISTFYNYLIGLALAVFVCLLLKGGEPSLAGLAISRKPYIYFGGFIGVGVVLLSNMTVMRISAFYLSLFLFTGQVFSGVLIDALITRAFSAQNLIGGVFVAAGLLVNLLLDSGRAKDK